MLILGKADLLTPLNPIVQLPQILDPHNDPGEGLRHEQTLERT